MYERVLIPTDGSPGTAHAVDHALDIASQYSAALYILFVVDTDALPLDAHSQAIFEHLDETGKESVENIVKRAENRGIDSVTEEVLEGNPYEVVDEHNIDLVVMGTHGRRGLDRYFLGSVTERVVRLADVPVLTVQMKESG